jgi:hypothetical protein
MFCVYYLAGTRDFSSPQFLDWFRGLIHCIMGALHLKVEQPGHEADHLLVSSVKVENVQRFNRTASVVS